MFLKKLIKGIPEIKKNTFISGISTDSRKVKKNYIFFAIKGSKLNGENFIKDAIKRGAVVIVCSESYRINHVDKIIIKKKDVRLFLSEIASKFYNLKPKNIIAVTGTNGKTSVADIFYQILRLNNIPVATIGTLGVKYNNKIIKTNLTSPDTISIHKYLYFLKKKKIDNVVIEASSHGLYQKRLNHLNFKAAIFTNFSQDHLDYHKTMKSYLNAKLILFKEIMCQKSVVISDKNLQLFKELKIISQKKNLKIQDISREFNKVKNISYEWLSEFRIKNISMAIKAIKLCGLKDKFIYNSIKKLRDVNGRLELIKKYPNNIKIFIDYAHTPDALLKTLESLKTNYGNNISLVFGCGGDRDKKKRSIMAKIANNNCKKIYVTDDNPRNENPKKIRNDLLRHINKNKAYNIGNRFLAIKKSLINANPNEIILVAGKGHEVEQIYKNKINYISDKKIIKKIKLKKTIFSKEHQYFLENEKILNEILKKKKLLKFKGVSIDSRKINKNNLFLAIKGKKNDGNKFINHAFKKGAAGVVTSMNIKIYKKKIIKVNNINLFLNNFAKSKREKTLAKIISITGSAGKTSLKDLLKMLLQDFKKTYSSPKSFNNHYGVPISLSNLSFDDKFGIFEVGMSKVGEIRRLTSLINPHIGVITNIGEAHLENFKNVHGIAKAKSEIIEKIKTGGTIILNRDDKFFNFLFKKAKTFKLKVITFGRNTKSDVCLKKIIKKRKISRIFVKINKKKIDFVVNDLNFYNVLASIAVLKALRIDILKFINKFKHLESSEGRGKKYIISRYKKKFKFIDESYNANPLSVKSAIRKLHSIKKNKFKKYLILGDMLELGPKSKRYHQELSKVINNSDIDKVFVKGKKTIFTYKHLKKDKRGNMLQNNEDIDLSLGKVISNNDYLMIKGSNATGLNNFSKKMIKGV